MRAGEMALYRDFLPCAAETAAASAGNLFFFRKSSADCTCQGGIFRGPFLRATVERAQ